MRPVRLIGLTGGIASGKSTVAGVLRELGAVVIDADQVAREVVQPGEPALAEVVAAFGPEVLDATGALDRKRMGQVVFADPEARRRLNAILHPRIAERTQAKIAALRETETSIVVYEAPLLVENAIHHGLDGLIVVFTPEAEQRRRAEVRDGLTSAEVAARIAAQLPLGEKLAVADWVIDNGGTPEETRRQVMDLWQRISAGERGRRGRT
jgi:dephospho-CoA kinase